ncbi:MAG TPA: PIN domain-containing protein [Candidatus Limnocylindrales bacterium]|nr:PIN domain-containing protein [Candidatus Limnocylindrales bacterium]
MRYLLDTTFVIDHLRGDPDARRRLAQIVERGDEPFVCDVVACEAWAGAHDDLDRDLMGLLRFVEFVQAGPEQARRAGRWRADARRRGSTLSAPDALIAASAEALDATVLTRNLRDFALMPIPVETY